MNPAIAILQDARLATIQDMALLALQIKQLADEYATLDAEALDLWHAIEAIKEAPEYVSIS